MNLEVGSDQGKFRSYYLKTIASEAYKRDVGENDGSVELEYVAANSLHLILWKDGEQILGHAIWHESNTDEHRPGVPREEDDKRLLGELLGGRADFIELHELWLLPEHRGKGYGRRFFDFFESFISSKGHDIMVHHTFDETVRASVAGEVTRRSEEQPWLASLVGYSVSAREKHHPLIDRAVSIHLVAPIPAGAIQARNGTPVGKRGAILTHLRGTEPDVKLSGGGVSDRRFLLDTMSKESSSMGIDVRNLGENPGDSRFRFNILFFLLLAHRRRELKSLGSRKSDTTHLGQLR